MSEHLAPDVSRSKDKRNGGETNKLSDEEGGPADGTFPYPQWGFGVASMIKERRQT